MQLALWYRSPRGRLPLWLAMDRVACGSAEREAEEGEPLACVQPPAEEGHGEDGRGEDLRRGVCGGGWWWRGDVGEAEAEGGGVGAECRARGARARGAEAATL